LDDDCIVENDYLEKLLMVINEGFDLASGVTPPMAGNLLERDTRFVMPVINRVFIDKDGFIVNSDDCGFKYAEDKIIITDHFRSCALYKKSVCEKVRYEDNLANSGFREEEFFSFRMILEGFKLGVHTGAIAWHLQAQSGGDRKPDYTNHALINQKLLNRFVIKQFEKNGNFIEKYHERLGLEMPKLNSVKNTNLIFSKEV
jgi:GT2 family glycosyltransferase